ncbi:MAG TPA: YceI family protein [Opitutaceae bacterium]|nr:YceI family protein [Opitutaceae bacterium]
MNRFHRFTALASVLALAGSLSAGPQSFDFKDPKGVNNVQFHLDAPLESISGQGTGISGTVAFDAARPAATTGRIVLATASLTVGNPTMLEHLQGANWLDAAKHPEILFELKRLDQVVANNGVVKGEATGVLTLKGVSKEVTVPVTISHLPGKLGARLNQPDLKGDLLVVRAQFAINRSDFGIQPGQYADKVSERIDLTLSLAGGAAQ